jgi:hypothetical protein
MQFDRVDVGRRREAFIRAKYERQAWARAPAAAGLAVANPTPTPAPAPVATAAPAPARAATTNVNAAASLFAGTQSFHMHAFPSRFCDGLIRCCSLPPLCVFVILHFPRQG